jgi:2-polyprenyl-3-methyl-5-hydroxy-6-metoxy-1,4-benzoquinol methylase
MSESDQLRHSWIENAAAWRDAVRQGRIESRRVATDAAIIETLLALQPKCVADLGCGEGWLVRALAQAGVEAIGIDYSAPLIDAAAELGGGAFHTFSYEDVATGAANGLGVFDVAVANFAILDADVRPIFSAAATLIPRDGWFVIQTVHPLAVLGDEPYVSGWRTETFQNFGGHWPAPMPWYFRTIETWVGDIAANGFALSAVREPLNAQQNRPLSMILVCTPDGGA